MANKQYEMLFKLGARLGENFKGTFNSAQKVLSATQKEIQALNKQQSDLQSYQKLQNGVEKTNSRLETYRKQLEITQSGLAKLKQSTEDTTVQETQLAAREVELKNRIRETEQKLSDQNARLRQMGENLTQAGVDINNIIPTLVRMDEQIEELTKQEEQAAQEAEQFGNSGESAFETVGSALVAAGIVTALKKIAEAYKECVGVSMEFGATMSTVEALSGSNAVQMQDLTAKAKELGAETAFTANQAASAMTYMGMAGWDATEMLAGMDGMINLAAASGEDLALVSDIVTDNLTAFGLTAKDTAHFADVLAAAATNSNTNVAIMGETFSGSAAIAGALGYSIEDVAVGVGLMANAGVKGSIAGTALKNTFNGLLNGATLTAKAFGEVEFSAINADGTIDSFSDTIVELRGYFDQMTEAERVQNAMLLAGQRGYNGLLAILNSTESDYQTLTDKINNCTGAAQKMADTKLDNLQGDVTLLNSAADGLKMTIGEACNDELRKLTQMGTAILTGINDFCSKNPEVVKGIIGVTTGLATTLVTYKAFTAARKIMNTVSAIHNALVLSQAAATGTATAAQIGLNTAMSANPVGLLVTGIGALAGLLVTAVLSYESAIPTVEELTEKAREFDTAMQEANADFEDNQVTISANADTADYYIDKLEEIEAATDGNVAENEEYHNILALLTRTVPELADSIDLETNSIEGGTEALRQHTEAYRKDAEEQARQEYINSVYDEYGEVVKEVAENKIKLTQAQLKEEQAQQKAEKTLERMNELRAEAEKQAGGSLFADYYLTNEFFELQGALYEYNTEVSDARIEQHRLTEAIETGEQAIEQAKEEVDLTRQVVEKAADSTEQSADTVVSAYDMVKAAIDGVSEKTTELLQAYNDAYKAAYDSVNGQYNLWTEAEETIPTSIDTINNALSSQTEYWDNYNYNLETLSERAGDIEGLSDVIASFADGSSDSVNVIAGMADAADEELEAMVQNFQEQQKMQEEVSKTLAEYRIDIDNQMDELVDSMERSIEDMDLSGSAEVAAKATIQAYADAILAGKGSVVEAADIVAAAAKSSMSYVSSYDPSGDVGYTKVAADHAYASGTDYAEKGIALVGEEGPELVMMRGGERVIDAENTKVFLSGGSPDYVNIIPENAANGEEFEAMVKGFREQQKIREELAKLLVTDEEFEAMVKYFREQQKIQGEDSKALAEYGVGVDNQMGELVGNMEFTAADMNMSDTAEQAAKATIQAYAHAILSGKGSAVEAADIVSNAAANALSTASYYEDEERIYREVSPSEYGSAYADGTDYAERGVALVGEEGPELVMMSGGEKVIDADNTEALLSGGLSGSVNVISGIGEATDEELEAKVQNFQVQQRMQEEVSKALVEYRADIDNQMDGIVSDMKAADIAARAAANALATERYYEDEGQQIYREITSRKYNNAYANGTDSAERGVALVGEEGPELVMMRGGEKVIDADNTEALLSGGLSGFVNVMAGMGEATDEELEAKVQNFQVQQRMQEEVSKALAEYRADIDNQMDGIVSDMKAADIAARAAANALATERYYEDEGQQIYREITTRKYNNAYANGTDSAERGVALVGEEGPELVMMHGGERVIDAENTKALLSGGSSVQISIAPQFVVNGEISEITENKLQEMSAHLIDMFMDALEEAGIDKQRSVYA